MTAAPASIPCWDRLTDDAKRTLCQVASLFDRGLPVTAEIAIGHGGMTRGFDVRLGKEAVSVFLTQAPDKT